MQQDSLFHPLENSCLYGLTSANKLATLLYSSLDGLNALAQTEKRYRCWTEKKKSGGERHIEAPDENLKKVQRRIADLLQRISPPDYLMAPVRKRSYVDNAATHIGAKAFCLLDIEDFFPSCTDKKVFWFFNKRMNCAPHVAALLTKLVTFRGHLPQGSPCSPILAFLAYSEMWDEIHAVVIKSGCSLSVYADDITVSGNTVYGRDVWQIKKILFRHGHRYSRRKERHIVDKPADITGVIVTADTLLLPNRQHQKIFDLERMQQLVSSRVQKDKLARQLRGRYAQASQIQNYSVQGLG
jgi:Reverse transcriptase (RNA-dependent DNA polymerase)